MYPKTFSAAAALLAASTMVSAQTFTECNPLEKTCPADPAFGSNKINCDMTQGECGAFHELAGTNLKYGDKGAIFSISKETEAPTIATGKYIFFGRLDVEVQAANGQGVVTSCVLQSDDLDEIDWEWVGGDSEQVQTNFFSKGDTSTYDRGAYHSVSAPLTSFHTYSVEWTSEAVKWMIDGAVVRTLKASEAEGTSGFPQTPMQVKLGTWVAGRKDAPKGTVEWAGGYTDFSSAPFEAFYKSVKITDYAGGSSATSDKVKEYVYSDKSGDWESIDIVGGSGSSDKDDDKTKTKETKTHTKTNDDHKTKTHSSEAETTSKADKTSSKAETSSVMTTFTTAGSNSTMTKTTAESTSSVKETGSSTSAPAKVDDDSAAPRTIANVVLAGAGLLLAQLML